MISYIVFNISKTFKNTSFVNFLKFLAIIDSLCLLIEFIKSTNELLIYKNSQRIFNETNFTCKFFNYLSASLHLISAWLVCAFTIERCVAINCPLRVRRIFSLKNTKLIFLFITLFALISQIFRLLWIQVSCIYTKSSSILKPVSTERNISIDDYYQFEYFKMINSENCLTRCKCEAISNEYGLFLLKFHVYFHQLICLVLIPTSILIISNTLVIYRLIKRKRFHPIKSISLSNRSDTVRSQNSNTGSLYDQSRHNLPNNADLPILHRNKPHNHSDNSVRRLNTSKMFSSVFKAASFSSLNFMFNQNKSSTNIVLATKRNHAESGVFTNAQIHCKDLKLCLLIIVSGSFLILVLPETVLNIYKFHRWKDSVDKSFLSMKNVNLNNTSNEYILSLVTNFCINAQSLFNHMHILEDVFYLLKLLNYASMYFAYLSLSNRFKLKQCLCECLNKNRKYRNNDNKNRNQQYNHYYHRHCHQNENENSQTLLHKRHRKKNQLTSSIGSLFEINEPNTLISTTTKF